MPTVAQQLRTAREAQQLSIEEVAELTKLRTDHVRALESGNYKVFSAPVYVRGFTRTYAKLLKLDTELVLKTLRDELSGKPVNEDGSSALHNSKGLLDLLAFQLSKINWKIALPILVFFILIAIGSLGVRFWQYQQSRDPLENLGDGRYSPPEPPPSAYGQLPSPGSITPPPSQ